MATTTRAISKSISLDDTRRRIERWRETRSHRHAPMPSVLWDAAVAAARQHGLSPTARAVRVDYGALKQHMETGDPDQALTATMFLELVPGRPMRPTPRSGRATSGRVTSANVTGVRPAASRRALVSHHWSVETGRPACSQNARWVRSLR